MAIQSIDPSTGKTIKTYEDYAAEEVNSIVDNVNTAYLSWRSRSFEERSVLTNEVAGVLRANADRYARIMAQEMGKPVRDGRGEVQKCAWVCEYYADNAARFLAPESIVTEAKSSFVTFQPLGVILAVMPWNFPFWQVFRFAAPALMAGNVCLLKHSSNVPESALSIEAVFREAGLPADVFRTLLIGSDRVGEIISHPLVKAVTLTGSTPAGRAVAGRAGERLKKTVLELGGSDPYIVLEDTDLSLAASTCVTSRLINNGQSCIAGKRFIVVESIRQAFESLFVDLMQQRQMGDPLLEDTDLGPMARHDLRDELHRQVIESVNRGAVCLLGGNIPENDGAFYPPTVLTGVKKGMPAFDEELFGPVAAIVPAADESEAVRLANDSIFGLGAAVFTEDIDRGRRIATVDLEAGCCFVNSFVKSDPRLPFGGIKESGYGRELSHYGIKEFVNIKTVSIA